MSGREPGACGPREATWGEVRAGQAAMWDAIASLGPGSAEAARASDLADATFVSWQRSGVTRQATAGADQQANPEAGQ